MGWYDIVGAIAAGCYLAAYGMFQRGKFDLEKGYSYSALNLLGAALMLISLIGAYNFGSLLINGSWVIFSAYGIHKIHQVRKVTMGSLSVRREFLCINCSKELPMAVVKREQNYCPHCGFNQEDVKS